MLIIAIITDIQYKNLMFSIVDSETYNDSNIYI